MKSPSPALSSKREKFLRAIAQELKALNELPLLNKQDVLIWDDEAHKFRKKLYSIYEEVYDELPHELEHYLRDADIRLKDAGYKVRQEGFVRSLILKLEVET